MKKPYDIDLVIINPGNRKEAYQSLHGELTAIENPVWAGMIAENARLHGHSVALIDANADELTPGQVAEQLKEVNPLLAVIVVYGHHPSASTQNMPAVHAISSAIKSLNPEQKLLLLGGHVSSLPERTLREEPADYVCEGEGPSTLHHLLACLTAGTEDQLNKVPGLWYWEDGQIQHNPVAPLIGDMDVEFPMQAWDLMPMPKYRAHNWHCFGRPSRMPYASIYTTLGCPYNCVFCCINAPFGGPGYRRRSPENVIKEIDCLVNEYGVQNIKIADELFVLREDHVGQICDLLIERNYDLNFWAYARVDTIDKPQLLEKMRAAGIRWLALGIESGSERVLKDAHKSMGKENIYDVVNRIHEMDIHIIGNYIFGLPEDDLLSMRETLDLAKDLNCAFGNFYSAIAYPGSKLYDMALEKGWPMPETWGGYSQHAYDTLPLATNYLTGPEVLRFRDEAFKEYYSHSDYQESVRQRFGDAEAAHIKDMLKKDLKRKYLE